MRYSQCGEDCVEALSVSAAGPGCRIRADLISTMRLFRAAGISFQPDRCRECGFRIVVIFDYRLLLPRTLLEWPLKRFLRYRLFSREGSGSGASELHLYYRYQRTNPSRRYQGDDCAERRVIPGSEVAFNRPSLDKFELNELAANFSIKLLIAHLANNTRRQFSRHHHTYGRRR